MVILHAGVLVATHAQRIRPDQADRVVRPRLPVQRRARDATVGLTVPRCDGSGALSLPGAPFRACRRWARQPVHVSIVAGSVQPAKDGQVIRVHPIRPDRSRELGAFANPKGRPPEDRHPRASAVLVIEECPSHVENDRDSITDPAMGRLRGRSTAGCLAMVAVRETAVCGPEFDLLGAASRSRC